MHVTVEEKKIRNNANSGLGPGPDLPKQVSAIIERIPCKSWGPEYTSKRSQKSPRRYTLYSWKLARFWRDQRRQKVASADPTQMAEDRTGSRQERRPPPTHLAHRAGTARGGGGPASQRAAKGSRPPKNHAHRTGTAWRWQATAPKVSPPPTPRASPTERGRQGPASAGAASAPHRKRGVRIKRARCVPIGHHSNQSSEWERALMYSYWPFLSHKGGAMVVIRRTFCSR